MVPSSLVVLNPAAHGGRAARLWNTVEPAVTSRSRPQVVCTDPDGHWTDAVRRARARGVQLFFAAGGDGTVNALVNALSPHASVTLGAIGLGSSNDFHKPATNRMGDIPLRVDPQHTRLRDVGIARYADAEGVEHARCFVVSASLGLTAEANAVFNGSRKTFRWLKRTSTSAAILYAAVRTLAKRPSFAAQLWLAGDETPGRSIQLTNLSVMKTPHLSGWMHYDTPVEPDDGQFAINLCDGLGRLEVLSVLRELSRGRFLACGRAGTHHFRAAALRVRAPHPVALELDGEVVHATNVTFELLPEQLRCCV